MEDESGTPILKKENVVHLMIQEEKNIKTEKMKKCKVTTTTLMAVTIFGLILLICVMIGKTFRIIRNVQITKYL